MNLHNWKLLATILIAVGSGLLEAVLIEIDPMATACVNGVLLLCLGIAIIYGIAEKEQRPAQLRQPHQQEHDRHDYENPWYHTRFVPDMRDSSARLLSSLEERIAEANKTTALNCPTSSNDIPGPSLLQRLQRQHHELTLRHTQADGCLDRFRYNTRAI